MASSEEGRDASTEGMADHYQSLDPQRPDLLGDQSVILTSRRLAVADMRDVVGDDNAIEVEATGDAHIRGSKFTASGARVYYVKAKDQVVLEGDGRTEATIAFQRRSGEKPTELNAEKIIYNPQTSQVNLQGFELKMSDLKLSDRSQNSRVPNNRPAGLQPRSATPPAPNYRN